MKPMTWIFAALSSIVCLQAHAFDPSQFSSARTVQRTLPRTPQRIRLKDSNPPRHSCVFESWDQYYNIHSLKLEKIVRGKSPHFLVSLTHHEQSTVKITNELGEETVFTTLTGTLVDKVDGPVISASAHFKHFDREEAFSLVMAVGSPMAKTTRHFDFEKDSKYRLLSITLKCNSVQNQ